MPSTISTKSRCAYVNDESFSKLGNLKSCFDISANHGIFIPVGRAKYAIHRWATNRKVTTEKHVYFCSDCNINTRIDCHLVLRTEEDMLAIKKKLSDNFMKENDPKSKLKSNAIKFRVASIESV